MTWYIKDSGGWANVKDFYVKNGGAWVRVFDAYTARGGTWDHTYVASISTTTTVTVPTTAVGSFTPTAHVSPSVAGLSVDLYVGGSYIETQVTDGSGNVTFSSYSFGTGYSIGVFAQTNASGYYLGSTSTPKTVKQPTSLTLLVGGLSSKTISSGSTNNLSFVYTLTNSGVVVPSKSITGNWSGTTNSLGQVVTSVRFFPGDLAPGTYTYSGSFDAIGDIIYTASSSNNFILTVT